MAIKKLIIDSTDYISDLCEIMTVQKTDKSPYSSPLLSRNDKTSHGCANIVNSLIHEPVEYAHAYTGVYNTLFSPLRYKEIKFGEIGVNKNHSIRGWREYFPKAEIHGFEWLQQFINSAKNENLENVHYHFTNVEKNEEINKSFKIAKGDKEKFDIIIEDSCHHLQTQANVVETVHKYLKPGGMLIVEDIFPQIMKMNDDHGDYVEEVFETMITPFLKNYSDVTWISPKHKYAYSGLYGEIRMLLLIK